MNLQATIREFVYANLQVMREEGHEFACLCPFHENFDSPALYVNKDTGVYHCFNPACGAKGRFAHLVKNITGEELEAEVIHNDVVVTTFMSMYEYQPKASIDDGFDEAMERILINYNDPEEVSSKLKYLINRGFSAHALEYFEVGFSVSQNRIVIPVRDEKFKVVGFIGRAIDNDTMPKYKYTDKFPRRNLLLNLCNAKQHDSVVVVEGSLDHIKVYQAGFPSVVSTMGSTVTEGQIELLNKYFNTIIIFADNDEAGEKMRDAIIEGCPRKDLWVVQNPGPENDPGDMTSEQIQNAINNKLTYLELMFNKL